jgi:hypothetical protein
MKKTILNENDYNLFYKSIIFGDINNPISASIKSAYRDVCRTITGFSKKENHSQIFKEAYNILYNEINKLLKSNFKTQEEFDIWHKNCCDELIESFGSQIFYYGQSQKWINMSLKNLSMLSHDLIIKIYEYCHVPIDNYILNAVDYSFGTPWSRINNYDKYLEFQSFFRKKYNGIPLDNEFKIWLKETRNV